MPEIEGKATPIDWASFKGRTRLDMDQWVRDHNFRTYADVRSWCVSKGVTPPLPDEVPLPKRAGKKGATEKKVAPPIPDINISINIEDIAPSSPTQMRKSSKRKSVKKGSNK